MAFYDNTLVLSNAQAISGTAASTNIYDVTGAGSGNAPALVWGTPSTFGADIGAGDGMVRPTVLITVTTAIASTSINFQVQAAIDNGSNAPGTYVTLSETGVVPAAQLTAGTQIVLPIPPIPQGSGAIGLPRFYRVNYVVVGGSTGNVTAVILLNVGQGSMTRYPSNFTVV